ncbi:MAG TPA: nitroreductase family deazaflavin-dependent oxidoreductase [Mycobacterium sp.]|nr:nitroreductase family deazaflavin-dependent oxidoreductase [Mycobacterium sp.]
MRRSREGVIRTALTVVAVAVTAVVTVILGILAAIRFRVEPVLTGVRRLNRVTNRGVLRVAGTGSSRTAVIVHLGRRSGRTYRTPVHADRIGTSFVIALPYGDRADWVRNVLANGGAVVESDGRRWLTANPMVVPSSEVMPRLPLRQQRAIAMFDVAECLRLDVTHEAD